MSKNDEDNDIHSYYERLYLGKTNFDYYKITEEPLEERINKWLYPIRENERHDFVIDVLLQNLEYTSSKRNDAFAEICKYFNIDKMIFNKEIDELQESLIKFNKVKVCLDGKVIMMEVDYGI